MKLDVRDLVYVGVAGVVVIIAVVGVIVGVVVCER